MTPGPDWDHRGQPPEGDAHVRQQLASIDGSLYNGMPVDDRYESGVPEGQRGNSLDFIQMTGLTRPPLRPASHGVDGSLAQTPIYEDLNPSDPVSFYEKGVSDVDDTLGRDFLLGELRDATLDTHLVPNLGAGPLALEGASSRSAQAFRDIVAGLQRGDAASEVMPPAEAVRAGDGDTVAGEETAAAEPFGGSASGALLALVEELESVMGVEPDPVEKGHLEEEGPSEALVETREPAIEASGLLTAPAAEIDDDDFDALLSSLSGHSKAMPEEAAAPAEEAAASAAGISDEWDALLDTMPVRGSEPPPAPESPPAFKMQSSGALAEAEQLMQALEKRPKSASSVSTPARELILPAPPISMPPVEPVPTDDAGWVVPATAPTALDTRMRASAEPSAPVMALPVPAGQEAEPEYDYSAAPSRRRSRRHSRVARRGLKMVKAALYLLLLGALVATLWIFVAGPMLLQDEDLSARAERLMSEHDYSAASQTYLQLASRLAPGDAERSNAEFRAAYALTLGPERSGDETKSRYGTAVLLFKKFAEDYPQHPKRARALSILGRLHFELQDFEQAIVVLRDQVKPADDPAAALSMLRYLARAYSMTGNYEQAETSYLQAATLPGNYNAEADYLELGDLFRQRAGLTKGPGERAPLEAMAMSYWRRALQVPGLAPGDRTVLDERLKWLSYTDQNEGAAPGAAAPAAPAESPAAVDGAAGGPEGEAPAESPAAAPSPAPAMPAEESPAPPVSTMPVPSDGAGRAEVPGAELEALVPAASPAGE